MPNFRLLTGLFICAAMLCAAAAPAAAQQQEDGARAAKSFYQYDKKYRRSIHDNDSQDISVLGQGLLHLTLLRDESDPPGDFMLRLSSPVSVSGCADIGHPEITMHKSSSALFFTLKEGTATAEKIRATRYPHYQCNTKAQLAYIDIPLNRDDLIKNNIKKIHMKNKSGLTYHDLEIEADQNKITMRGPLGEETRWFYPPGTVILYAPSIGPGKALGNDLAKKARARGLVPMEEILEDFKNPEYLKNSGGYFLDPMGVLHREIKVAGKPVFFGKATIEEIFHGPRGAYQRPREIDLYAKIPGEFE